MKLTITHASMTYSREEGYVGKLHFEADGHLHPYEITLHRKRGKDWSYGLFFVNEPGREEDIFAVEDYLEEDDEAFEGLIDAAMQTLEK
jgi:hypothetical protein